MFTSIIILILLYNYIYTTVLDIDIFFYEKYAIVEKGDAYDGYIRFIYCTCTVYVCVYTVYNYITNTGVLFCKS